MALGITRDADLEFMDFFQAFYQIIRILIAARSGYIFALVARHVAAQGHDMADAVAPVAADDVFYLFLGMADAGQVRGGVEAGALLDLRDDMVRTVARGAAGAVSDRDELGVQLRK